MHIMIHFKKNNVHHRPPNPSIVQCGLAVLSCLLWVNVCLSDSYSATGILMGKITDSDHFSLPGANIMLPEINTGTASDQNGNYRLNSLPQGEYTIKVMYIGYLQQTFKVHVIAKQTTVLNVVLESGILEMDAVTVVGERLKGQAKALNQQKANFNISNIISAEQIGRFPDQNIGDALKRIPGFSVNYNEGEARYANVRGT
ncbi:MAG: TonB-dependent receptor, partial [Calditrichaeota bacterium]